MSADCDSRLGKRKSLGSFYTPRVVARVLTDWAIPDAHTTVFDPSYGGCAFLYAALDTLRNRGSVAPGSLVYGVDIDPDARAYLGPLLESGASRGQFLTADFFHVESGQFLPGGFGAVVGNPPFIRHHDIPADAREQAAACLTDLGIDIPGRASYWAFFLLYSTQFLRPGGRLAMVLPTALIQADYSAPVREFLARQFESLTICLLDERIFDGTDEQVAVVCAAGAGYPHRRLRVGTAASVRDLPGAVHALEMADNSRGVLAGDEDWVQGLVDPSVRTILEQLHDSRNVIRLGEWVKTGIGVVTGNNGYFILSRRDQQRTGIPQPCLAPVVRRPSYLKGLWVTDEDLLAAIPEERGSFLLAVAQTEPSLPQAVREYIQHGQETGVPHGRKCSERHPWYAVRDLSVPQAFVPCMSATWPRLVPNRSSFTCTNNILRLFWKEEREPNDWLRLALGTLSTLSQLSAELVGRSYGGGVLKVEPGGLAHLAVPLVPSAGVEELAREVDLLLRGGQLESATDTVDKVLSLHGSLFDSTTIGKLRVARDWFFSRRRGRRHRPHGHTRE